MAASRVYQTAAIGGGRQPDYLNAVLAVVPNRSPAALLRLVKGFEHRAGRRANRHWGPRPLDIDIVDFRGQRHGWPKRRRGILTLPHPHVHERAFVLRPLLDMAPHWRHPALGVPGRTLLLRIGARSGRMICLGSFAAVAGR